MKRHILTAVAALVLSLQLSLAEKKVPLQNTATVPAAEGRAILDQDKNGNLEIKIEVRHLAKPEQLTPAKQVYVVWIQPSGEQPHNAGALKVNDDLKGEFRARTPYKNLEVFVTAEDSATATTPAGPEVLRQHLQK